MKMAKCELCGTETDAAQELYGRMMCRDCYEYYKAYDERRSRGCCFCR
ncbi:MAG TPA: hypothetical protein VMW40_03190 [Candidatus Bathyarchaeia archaeon]|nr:hypothetical protein [Candidatus Bathyarchaeia archaeon]